MRNILIIFVLSAVCLILKAEEAFYYGLKRDGFDIPKPIPSTQTSSKWWSSSLFGNVHKKICKKAYEFIDSKEYPDLIYYKSRIVDGCADEEGHRNPDSNGGDVKDLWFGTKDIHQDTNGSERVIGVIFHYEVLNWNDAYENIGTIVHLTQDQASPAHAANIKHSYFDQFERFYESDNEIKITRIDVDVPNSLKPWEYYFFVQKNTRNKLKEWFDPDNGVPYWEESPNALPLDKDNTLGAYGRYGGGSDHFSKSVCSDSYDGHYECTNQPKSPKIRERQITLSILATEKLLKSASKNLPPVIKDFKISKGFVEFTVYDNRCRKISYFTDDGKRGIIELDNEFPFSKSIKLKKNFSKITIVDCDENKISKSVN